MIETLLDDNASPLRDCQSMMVCLEGRRFVIVHPDENPELAFASGDKSSLRELESGDVVSYRGRSVTVRAVEVYR